MAAWLYHESKEMLTLAICILMKPSVRSAAHGPATTTSSGPFIRSSQALHEPGRVAIFGYRPARLAGQDAGPQPADLAAGVVDVVLPLDRVAAPT